MFMAVLLFVVAGLAEIGGGYMVWLWLREARPLWYGIVGSLILIAYGVIPTLQSFPSFGRVYAAYGGVFVVLAVLWGFSFNLHICSSDAEKGVILQKQLHKCSRMPLFCLVPVEKHNMSHHNPNLFFSEPIEEIRRGSPLIFPHVYVFSMGKGYITSLSHSILLITLPFDQLINAPAQFHDRFSARNGFSIHSTFPKGDSPARNDR